MFTELFVFLEHLIAPESSWNRFLRKLTLLFSTSVVSIVGFQLWFVEQREIRALEEEQSIARVIEVDSQKLKQIETVLEQFIRVQPDEHVASVWLYNWSYGRGFEPVTSAGEGVDPLPLGYWFPNDEATVGALTLGRCENLKRLSARLHACPVSGLHRTRGIVVVQYKNGVKSLSAQYKARVAAVSHKIAQLLY